MTPEHWKKAKDVLETALAQPASERHALLEQVLGEEPELRRQVESLLEFSEDDPSSIIEQPIFNVHAKDPGIGRRIGPYRTVRLLGRGGMGAVYLAEREDFDKRVAVKLIKPGLDTEEIVRRFYNERQVLAQLEHPNITRLLDGGTTSEGLPYFVMEYIDGEPIDQYCDNRRLTVSDRIELFRQVCSAVHLSHQTLVVHRDLKPSNILVTEEGVPKLLDFGIAKLLQPGLGASGLTTEHPPMTLEYASPEQVGGERITTASDVFALGGLLYRLLTGHAPFRAPRLEGMIWAICKTEPPRPSVVVQSAEESRARQSDPRKLSRRLAGDLDSIVMKALRKEPQHRYSSVEQFSRDLRCHLEGLPVTARADTFVYRAGKFVRRNRLALVAAVGVMVLIIGFAVSMVAQVRQTIHERDRAESIVQSLEKFFGVSDSREMMTLQEILDLSSAGRQGMEPDLQARLTNIVAQAYMAVGSYDRVRPWLEDALRIRQEVFGDEHWLVAETQHILARLLVLTGDDGAADELSRRALEIQRQHFGESHLELAKGISNRALLLTRKDVAGAEQLYREALSMKLELYGKEHLEVATSLSNVGTLALARNDLDEAERLFMRSLAIRRKLLPPTHPQRVLSVSHMGRLLFHKGDVEEAAAKFHEVLKKRRATLPQDHPKVVKSLGDLVTCLEKLGKNVEAEQIHREALEIHYEKLGPGLLDVATTQKRLALLLAAQGRYQEAEELILEALATFRKLKGRSSRTTQKALGQVIDLYEAWDKPEKAEQYRTLVEMGSE